MLLSRRRLDPDARLGLRLTLAAVAVFLVGVPFLLLALLVREGWGPLRRLDIGAATELHEYAVGHIGFVRALEWISDVFDPWSWRVAAVVAAVWLLWRRLPRLTLWLLVTVVGGGVLAALLKEVVQRSRPALTDPVASAPGLSFPSGHAFGATVGCGAALLLALPLLRGRWRVVAALVAALVVVAVDFARVGLGVHYVTDVVAGDVLGLAWLAATTAAFEAWRRETGHRPAPLSEGVDPEEASAGRGLRDGPRG